MRERFPGDRGSVLPVSPEPSDESAAQWLGESRVDGTTCMRPACSSGRGPTTHEVRLCGEWVAVCTPCADDGYTSGFATRKLA